MQGGQLTFYMYSPRLVVKNVMGVLVLTVNGDWSMWSEWGSCSVTCDVGIQRRDRSCSDPYPDNYGDHCFGESRDDRICM